jgi:hypothetical protein
MDWIKKNTVFVVSCVVALIAIAASGDYLYVQMGEYEEAGTRLNTADTTINTFVTKKPHPGSGDVDNIAAVRQDIGRLNDFKQDLTATFKSIPVGGQTEQAFKSELAEMLAYIEREGKRVGLTTPTNFNLSFTAQKIGFRFASNSLGPLSVQLADLREITRILVRARVNSIESYRRVAVSPDDSGPNAVEDEYFAKLKITTNQFTGAVVHPYEVVFRCFSEEFGEVLEGIANSPYSIILKTVEVEPGEVRNIKPLFAAADEVFGLNRSSFPGTAMYGNSSSGATSRYGESRGAGGRGDARATARYGSGAGGRGDPRATARYGSGAGSRTAATPTYTGPPGTGGAYPTAVIQPSGPELILTEEPIKVTLILAVIRMPESPAASTATN